MSSIEDLQALCRQLPGVTEDVKWDVHLCFNVGGKMFLINSPDEFPVNASFKVAAEDFDAVLAQPGFSPASHLARYHWVHLDDLSRLSLPQWQQYLTASYELVVAKLPLKVRRQLSPA